MDFRGVCCTWAKSALATANFRVTNGKQATKLRLVRSNDRTGISDGGRGNCKTERKERRDSREKVQTPKASGSMDSDMWQEIRWKRDGRTERKGVNCNATSTPTQLDESPRICSPSVREHHPLGGTDRPAVPPADIACEQMGVIGAAPAGRCSPRN